MYNERIPMHTGEMTMEMMCRSQYASALTQRPRSTEDAKSLAWLTTQLYTTALQMLPAARLRPRSASRTPTSRPVRPASLAGKCRSFCLQR